MFHACACLVMSHPFALFANIQGEKGLCLVSLLQDQIGHHQKGGDC